MINDHTYQQEEVEFNKVFAEAGWAEIPLPNELRIQRIEEKALHELITKETIDFTFHSFGAVLGNFAAVFLSSNQPSPQDYKV